MNTSYNRIKAARVIEACDDCLNGRKAYIQRERDKLVAAEMIKPKWRRRGLRLYRELPDIIEATRRAKTAPGRNYPGGWFYLAEEGAWYARRVEELRQLACVAPNEHMWLSVDHADLISTQLGVSK